MIGPTETCVYSTAYRFPPHVPLWAKGEGGVAPIGTPLWGTQVYVLDEQMQQAQVRDEGKGRGAGGRREGEGGKRWLDDAILCLWMICVRVLFVSVLCV